MKRQIGHPAAHPFRLTRAAIQAHREHLPTPFLGCPVCARARRSSRSDPLVSPRQPLPADRRQPGFGERVDPRWVGGLPGPISASFERR